MKHKVFIDTSYLIALLLKKDARHQDALAAVATNDDFFVTTDLVLVELADSLSLPSFRAVVVSAIERIKADPITTVVPFTGEGMDKALSIFKSRADKSWGLIDCFSFVVMKENRVRRAFTFDDHFRQAGFETPLISGGNLGGKD